MKSNRQSSSQGSNVTEFSVSELSGALKRSVEEQFGLVRVRAELSGVKIAASGHVYMALKDDKAVLDGICWRGVASKLPFRPEDGLEVICTGKLTTYPARSKYQMVVERMEPAGAGALMALLEARKKKLAAEGLFAPERKKALPFLPQVIGVVTSPTGAVIRDILHRLNDRFPRHVIVWPVLVQGDGAAAQIASAIRGFNALKPGQEIARPDLLIVARGGGSIEDLWSFNEEEVVRAAAESDIPLISAVGHETDTTLIDFASDRRAPTPTGAAEIAVPVREDLIYTVADFGRRIQGQRARMIDQRREQLAGLARGLPSPRDILGLSAQKLDDLSERLPRGLKMAVQDKSARLNRVIGGLSLGQMRQRLGSGGDKLQSLTARMQPAANRRITDLSATLLSTSRMLESLSARRVLERGYTMVMDSEGRPITGEKVMKGAGGGAVHFADGVVEVVVAGDSKSITKKPKSPSTKKAGKKSAPKSSAPKTSGTDEQGSLF